MIKNLTSPLRLIKYGVVKPKFLNTASSAKSDVNLPAAFNFFNIEPSRESNAENISTSFFSSKSIITYGYEVEKTRPIIGDLPVSIIVPLIPELYKRNILDISTIISDLECPTNQDIIEKRAERLIVIRRKKMKKHKLKKLRKRMKFIWRRRRLLREIKREKAFQAALVNKFKEAEAFSPEKYITDKLKLANEDPLPKRWKGRRKPAFIIRQLMGLDPKINYKGF